MLAFLALFWKPILSAIVGVALAFVAFHYEMSNPYYIAAAAGAGGGLALLYVLERKLP